MRHGFIKVATATPEISVADPIYNAEKIIEMMRETAAKGVNLTVFPELCITAYTCGDLFLQKSLQDGALSALRKIVEASCGLEMVSVLGLPLSIDGGLYNCAAVIQNGTILGLIPKSHIPNYSEFYEKRSFRSGAGLPAAPRQIAPGLSVLFGANLLFVCENFPEFVLGVEICEDLWSPIPPSSFLALGGATVIANLSASDETVSKSDVRQDLTSGQSARLICGYLYASSGAGESTADLVFTGHSMIVENGCMLAESTETSGILYSELDIFSLIHDRQRTGYFGAETSGNFLRVGFTQEIRETPLTRHFPQMPFVSENPDELRRNCEKALEIQSLGLAKRLKHTGSERAVIGVSGGLDSTLALLVCARTMDLLKWPRTRISAVTMPCFGTTGRTKDNAKAISRALGAAFSEVDITASINQHFSDIGHNPNDYNVVYENAQARERTQVLMDIANGQNGLVIGTGDLSELALGWTTYNGDHMSMYGVNASVPKTLARALLSHVADTCGDPALEKALRAVLDTPVSPELLPAREGEISQITEDLVGPYELHDFFLYYSVRWGFDPEKVFRLACHAFSGRYEAGTVLSWLKVFYRRFFAGQFKRSCLPDGPKVGSFTLSPRGDWRMPSDASARLWLSRLEAL